ncbi:hypothetical protein FQR65_LT20114 [Abscondita terminalis]|nr:hypothetical protein FQR65_LT20114 [Abscondita terminalis]
MRWPLPAAQGEPGPSTDPYDDRERGATGGRTCAAWRALGNAFGERPEARWAAGADPPGRRTCPLPYRAGRAGWPVKPSPYQVRDSFSLVGVAGEVLERLLSKLKDTRVAEALELRRYRED